MKFFGLLFFVFLISCNRQIERTSENHSNLGDTIEVKGGIGIDNKTGGVIRVGDIIIKGEKNDTLIGR